jgi:hypothetical protein
MVTPVAILLLSWLHMLLLVALQPAQIHGGIGLSCLCRPGRDVSQSSQI